MSAHGIYQLAVPSYCSCGERLELEMERDEGVCVNCMAEAANEDADKDDMRAEVIEAHSVRSRHYRSAS